MRVVEEGDEMGFGESVQEKICKRSLMHVQSDLIPFKYGVLCVKLAAAMFQECCGANVTPPIEGV